MNNINHQKQNTPQSEASPNTHNYFSMKQDTRTCYCATAMTLKLKLINLASQNQVLKKKLTETQQQLQTTKQYQHFYIQYTKMQKAGLSKSKETAQSEHFSHNPRTALDQQYVVSTIVMKESQLGSEEISQKKEQSHRLESYEYFRKLAAAQDKQTVKSLQFSFDSKEWEESRANLHYDQQDLFTLREEYEQMLQNLEGTFQNKINLLQEEIERLNQNNLRLRQMAKNQQEVLQAEEYEIRKTGYFKPIQEEEIEESISEPQPQQISQISQIIYLTNYNQSQSLSTQHWGEVAEQMRDLKSTLQRTYDFLRSMTHQLKTVIRLCKWMYSTQEKVKMLPINEYLKLFEHKKKETMAAKKCQLLAVQNKELREIIAQLTGQSRPY